MGANVWKFANRWKRIKIGQIGFMLWKRLKWNEMEWNEMDEIGWQWEKIEVIGWIWTKVENGWKWFNVNMELAKKDESVRFTEARKGERN